MELENPQKTRGKVYTPQRLVTQILDLAGYFGPAIFEKRVMENSCGDGAFMAQIVERYCRECVARGLKRDEMRASLERCVYGIELDESELRSCRRRLDEIAAGFRLRDVRWRLRCGDATAERQYDGKMDFVIGNPPYVRVHNLGSSLNSVKNFAFTQSGMVDLYIVFYEVGIDMLAPGGTLAYITPSSFFGSVAGEKMRSFFVEKNLLRKVVDLKHERPFDAASTYTTIVTLQKGASARRDVEYYQYDAQTGPYYVDALNVEDFYQAGKFYFARRQSLDALRRIVANRGVCDVDVKNGFATLCDSVYVDALDFESKFVIPVVKASKGVWKKMIFPYDRNARPVSEDALRQDARLYEYLTANRAKLDARASEPTAKKYWYAYGRSQGVADVEREKLTINTLIRDERDLKLVRAPVGAGVYSGLYAVSATNPLDEVAAALRTSEFAEYVALLGKYKSGGFYAFSSKDVKTYLNYKLSAAR
ncbi:MAG: N-6 DNA methylase [Thermoguttaceae bacterium]|nr:N-6 DNA methylase [Thermoguttaceae bacterium]